MMSFMENLISDLDYPLEYQRLFGNIKGAEQLAQILSNKDSFVRDKIESCKETLKNINIEYLIREGFFEKRDIGEIVVNKTFAFEGSFQGYGIAVRGPIAFEKDVVIGRSTIIGPVYISEKSKVFDSLLRGGSSGSVYVGRNCALWDYTVIIRSLIGDNSLIHTCNVDDSIIGPNSNFGATSMMSSRRSRKIRSTPEYHAKLNQRIVLANYSYGSKIRILDPTTDTVLQTTADHFGTLSGTEVWLASGTIVYPGTIIGSGAKMNSTVPLIGYIPPRGNYSLFLSIKKGKKGKRTIQLKGTMAQQIKECSADPM
jgi:acetyltransferase-like isoleucine patch superfamily enzyme